MINSVNRSQFVGVRFKKEELLHIEQLAKQAGVKNLSEYIRLRLLDEEILNPILITDEKREESEFACEHDRELMKLMLRTFILTREIARKALEENKVTECSDIATAKLKEWKYIE
jgi:hypothetical protein